MKKEFNVFIGFMMDVNVVVLGEVSLGVVVGLDSCIYLMIGIGIGGGVVVLGKIFEGFFYLEMGYIMVC